MVKLFKIRPFSYNKMKMKNILINKINIKMMKTTKTSLKILKIMINKTVIVKQNIRMNNFNQIIQMMKISYYLILYLS